MTSSNQFQRNLLNRVQRNQILEAPAERLVRLGLIVRVRQLSLNPFNAGLCALTQQFRAAKLVVQRLQVGSLGDLVVPTSECPNEPQRREVRLVHNVSSTVLDQLALGDVGKVDGRQQQPLRLQRFVREELLGLDHVSVLPVIAQERFVSTAKVVLTVQLFQSFRDAIPGAVHVARVFRSRFEEVTDHVLPDSTGILPCSNVQQGTPDQPLDVRTVRVRIFDVLRQPALGNLKVLGALDQRVRQTLGADVVLQCRRSGKEPKGGQKGSCSERTHGLDVLGVSMSVNKLSMLQARFKGSPLLGWDVILDALRRQNNKLRASGDVVTS